MQPPERPAGPTGAARVLEGRDPASITPVDLVNLKTVKKAGGWLDKAALIRDLILADNWVCAKVLASIWKERSHLDLQNWENTQHIQHQQREFVLELQRKFEGQGPPHGL